MLTKFAQVSFMWTEVIYLEISQDMLEKTYDHDFMKLYGFVLVMKVMATGVKSGVYGYDT